MANEALTVNQNVAAQADLAISVRASNWYFAVCAIMGASTLAFMGLALTKPKTHRLFHYITGGITSIACIAYFAMGSNLGQSPIQAEFVRPGVAAVASAGTREIFWVRYIDWFITTPLLLMDLLITAAVPWPTIFVTILADEIMIVTGLVGALTSSSYKWGFWAFGMLAFFFIVYELVIDARQHASAIGGPVKATYLRCGVLTIGLWFLYPIAWGLSEGGNVIHPDSEAIFYGILDVLAKPGFGILLLLGHNNIDPALLGLNFHTAGAYAGEKGHHSTTTEAVQKDGAHNGTGTAAAARPTHGNAPAV